MEKFFKLKEHGTDVRTEVTAGLTTFFAMSYVLFVNPSILSQAGMPTQGVFLATLIFHMHKHQVWDLTPFSHIQLSFHWVILGKKLLRWYSSVVSFHYLSQ